MDGKQHRYYDYTKQHESVVYLHFLGTLLQCLSIERQSTNVVKLPRFDVFQP